MAAGDSSVAEMIAGTERGLYITRFNYTRMVHPREVIVTGLTRDGTFVIERGEIAYPIRNLRFTQSYLTALAQVEALSQERRLLRTNLGASLVPALKLSAFRFTGGKGS
jgi:predicted Zn-dependent protease